jgi:hypothetical protein
MPDFGAATREIGRSLRKIQNIPPKVCAMKREMICISEVVYYLCGCYAQIMICHFGSCLTTKPDLGNPKIKKALFVG